MSEIRRKIRLIVDEGAAQCPICRLPIYAGNGHQCEQDGGIIASCGFKLDRAASEEAGRKE